MENIEGNLFYSSKEKILFWVAGYTDNSTKLSEIRDMFNDCEKRFKTIIPVQHQNEELKTDVVYISRRYKHMRYFWINNVVEIPGIAYTLGLDWTMSKWLIN